MSWCLLNTRAVCDQILNDLVTATAPRFMRLTAVFNVRGGVYTTVVAEHHADNWTPKPVVELPGTTPAPR